MESIFFKEFKPFSHIIIFADLFSEEGIYSKHLYGSTSPSFLHHETLFCCTHGFFFCLSLLPSSFSGNTVTAFDYALAGIGGIKCTDKSTGIGGIATLFNGDAVGVTVEGLAWEELDAAPANASSILYWETLVGHSC